MKCSPIFYIFSSDLERNRYRCPTDVVEQGRVSWEAGLMTAVPYLRT